MNFKYGDNVQIVNNTFYKNAKAKVIYYSQSDNSYTVQLEHGHQRDFFASSLKKITKRGKK